ncbi:MAG: ArgR family transcriptional regulator [Muribaculaceae bacterium]|jgi:transcriptional regulator of arginine metabolism|nr:ArgR family transcriptional regulator [Muribaculaceae bacterium]
MKNKKTRLQLILELIKHNCVASQDELARLLAARGFIVTQATLSRDLKTLKATKVATDIGNYMYIIPDANNLQDTMLQQGQTKVQAGQQSSFISIDFSGHTAVIKTRNGYASGLAYDIDMSKPPEVLGTIAGADTVFAVLREGVSREQALEAFSRFLPINVDGAVKE